MGSATHYADAAKRLAGRSVLAVGSGIAAGSRLVAKGITALTADASDREAVCCLRFAHLEWRPPGGAAAAPPERLPVLLVGLATGFQVWRLDGANPAELLSRRDGPTKLLEAVPEPLAGVEDELRSERPLLAAALERDGGGDGRPRPHAVLLYSLRAQGFVRTLTFGAEVLGLAASPRLLVVALRGQLQAFDAATLRHAFSCLTYTPPSPPPAPPGDPRGRQQQFVTAGLSSSGSSAGGEALPAGSPRGVAAPPPPPPPLAPFALGSRWLAYAADAPPPPASGQAVAQRLPLPRRDSGCSAGAGVAPGGPGQPAGAPAGGAAVADAALQAAARGGQQLRAGLSAVGGAGLRFLSGQYQSWRQGRQGQPDVDAQEADAAVAGTVAVRDAVTRQLLAAFRPHTSPLAALRFSACGTLLATASAAGHSIHLFRIVPAAGGGDGTGGTGHAVHLYRLYRGVTPAAIADIALAPDASWVAVSTARGTTHLFHTPAAAPGACGGPAALQQQQGGGGEQGQAGQQAGEGGILGRPPKTPAAGRARRPGLLGGGVAGAATSAARNLYSGQRPDAAPIAAAFLAGGPGSPRAGPAPAASLLVATADGLLARRLLRAPPPPDAAAGAGSTGGAASPAAAASEGVGGAGGAPAAALEEAERWDVGRLGSWPEREEPLPGLAPPEGEPPEPCAGADCDAQARQLWVAQAEAGGLAEPGAPGAPPPLWASPQFRFFQLRWDQLPRQQPGGDGGAGASEGGEPWLESLAAEPLSPQ